jgi:dTDP-4-amino-4,6-dideoxygalactose transaminase
MTEIEAAIGIEQLKMLLVLSARRIAVGSVTEGLHG